MSRFSFREKRGENMKLLIENEELLKSDDFWNNNNYFGKLDLSAENEEDEEYEDEKASKSQDTFDTDFDSISSMSEEEENNGEEKLFRKGKKFLAEEVRHRNRSGNSLKIRLLKDSSKRKPQFKVKESPQKSEDSKSGKGITGNSKRIRRRGQEKRESNQQGAHLKQKTAFIHEHFTQRQLLKEAVITEMMNRKSLSDLLKLEEEKKKVRMNKHSFDYDSKVIFHSCMKKGIVQNSFIIESCDNEIVRLEESLPF